MLIFGANDIWFGVLDVKLFGVLMSLSNVIINS